MLIPTGLFGGSGFQVPFTAAFSPTDNVYLKQASGVQEDNNQQWTYSAWVKLIGNVDEACILEAVVTAGTTRSSILRRSSANGSNWLWFRELSGVAKRVYTDGVFRDNAAWQHVVVQFDGTQNSSNRVKIWVNGELQSTTHEVLSSSTAHINNGRAHSIGISEGGTTDYANAMFAECILVDNGLKTPTDFAKEDDNGDWVPIQYTGAFGAGGFYLDFKDSTDPGKDVSGNANHFTAYNYNSALHHSSDSPTNNYASFGASTIRLSGGTVDLGNGGRQADLTGTDCLIVTNLWAEPNSGKYYAEAKMTGSTAGRVGVCSYENLRQPAEALGETGCVDGYAVRSLSGNLYQDSGITGGYITFTTNDVVNIALDTDNNKVWFGVNGTWVGDPATNTGGIAIQDDRPFAFAQGAAGTFLWSFQTQHYANTVPSGFKPLCTSLMPTPDIRNPQKYFNVINYDDGQGAKVLGFEPDSVVCKTIDYNPGNFHLTDKERGVTEALKMNRLDAEATTATGLTAFNSDGFTVGVATEYSQTLGDGMLAWGWKEGALPGLSIIKYTGSGANQSIAHGLGAVPKWGLFKNRDTASYGWNIYHHGVGKDAYLRMDFNYGVTADGDIWQGTNPDATNFYLGVRNDVNNSGDNYIAYLFSEVPGFSSFTTYEGNGSNDGPFVYLGFRPKLIYIKTDNTDGWLLIDAVRNPVNDGATRVLFPDTGDAEQESTNYAMDILSNGFRIRDNSAIFNRSGAKIYVAAFAEAPIQTARAV